MSDQGDARTKQLEEARKRVEELKKKSKKDKKKKKQTKNTEEAKETSESETADKETTVELPEITSAVEEETAVDEAAAAQPAENPAEAEELTAPAEAILNTSVEVAASKESSNDASQLFGDDANDESDFMGTIQKQKETDEICRLKTELEASTAECKKLKFTNMEHETTIEDLQSEVEQLQKQLQDNQQELQGALQNLAEAQSKLTLQQANNSAPLQFAQFPGSTNQKAVGDTYQEPSNDYKPEVDRAALNKWRCWNVDMTSWRSIGSGPIVEF